MDQILLKAEPLTAVGFAYFGDVIEAAGRASRWINADTCERFDDLAQVDVSAEGGRALISIFRAAPRALPLRVQLMERHPLSSQAFYPLDARPFLIVVAEDGPAPLRSRLRVYLSSGHQGVNFHRNTWHHELLALEALSHFLVVDRGGPGENCEQMTVEDELIWVTVP